MCDATHSLTLRTWHTRIGKTFPHYKQGEFTDLIIPGDQNKMFTRIHTRTQDILDVTFSLSEQEGFSFTLVGFLLKHQKGARNFIFI